MHLPTAREFKANTLMMLRTILLTTQALEKLPGGWDFKPISRT